MKLSSKYFDEIRSKKTEKEIARDCESLGCKESGDYIAKSKNGKVNYYCIEHIRLHNKNYNFFSDMSEDEIIDFQLQMSPSHLAKNPSIYNQLVLNSASHSTVSWCK